ncbi:hypothetical protein [Legionella sp. 227]|uniref:hypothetical protein n=1 Tax=Legionella sp. 227 TaxID=3367288 RepID=UPI00370DDA16
MTIRYISFPIDGGLFNKNYVNADNENFTKHLGNAVLVHNKAFLDSLREQNKCYNSVYAFLYSNRQSYEIDLDNTGYTRFKGSAFSAIETVCQDLSIGFDPFLLADLYNKLPYGTAFNKAITEVKNGNFIANPNNEGHPTCPFDHEKIALLFAQLQKAAVDASVKHPGEDIIFDVFDSNQERIENTKRFFSKNQHLIPKGVTLNLNHYDGGEPTLHSSIDGEGVVYFNFAKHTIELIKRFYILRDEYAKLSIHPENPKTLMDIVAQYFARHPDLYQGERVPAEVTERVKSVCQELGLDETALKGNKATSDAVVEVQEVEKDVDKADDNEQALPAESMTVNSQTSNPGRSQYGFYAADYKEGQEKADPSNQKPSPMHSCTLF